MDLSTAVLYEKSFKNGGIFYVLFGLQMNAGGSEMFRNRAYFGKKQHCNGVYIKPPGYCILITGGKKDMVNLPAIDMKKTGENINRLRKQAGLSVKDLQGIFGFATPQAIYKWQQGA